MQTIASSAGLYTRRGFLRGVVAAGGAVAWGRVAAAQSPFELLQAPAPLKWLDPANAESDVAGLVQSWVTPVRQFYVRSHGNTPSLDPAAYRLKVNGLVEKELSLSLAELSSGFGEASVVATLQCAGNRREEFSSLKKVGGVQWGPGAIGNASWSGVSLAAVLKAAGVKDGAKHVQFTGRDEVVHGAEKGAFGSSIPLEKALAPETLLAYGMNGELLTPEHGFPLRAVVPGVFGVRSVKWLDTITVSAEESPNYFQQQAYKVMPPEVDEKTVDWRTQPAIQEMIINSAVGTVTSRGGGLRVRGYAIAPGVSGEAVAKVELTVDGGKTWHAAAFTSPGVDYCWRLWEAELPAIAPGTYVAVRAVSKGGVTQPETPAWNFKGYCFNGYHRRAV